MYRSFTVKFSCFVLHLLFFHKVSYFTHNAERTRLSESVLRKSLIVGVCLWQVRHKVTFKSKTRSIFMRLAHGLSLSLSPSLGRSILQQLFFSLIFPNLLDAGEHQSGPDTAELRAGKWLAVPGLPMANQEKPFEYVIPREEHIVDSDESQLT